MTHIDSIYKCLDILPDDLFYRFINALRNWIKIFVLLLCKVIALNTFIDQIRTADRLLFHSSSTHIYGIAIRSYFCRNNRCTYIHFFPCFLQQLTVNCTQFSPNPNNGSVFPENRGNRVFPLELHVSHLQSLQVLIPLEDSLRQYQSDHNSGTDLYCRI